MKRYESYKDSGLKWLGAMPDHWRFTRIRAVTKQVVERDRPDLPLLSVYRDYGVILKDSRDDNHNRAGDNLNQYKVVKPGRLVLNKMKTWQGSLGVSDYLGIVSPAYITCDLEKIHNPYFLHFLLRSRPYVDAYNMLSYGVRVDQWDMRYEDFKQIPLYIPPRKEQDAIVAFLNQKLAEIDRFITNKERLIELLKEQKAAIINRAVTRGVDPNVPMKQSGIDELGEIPVHWKIERTKYIFHEFNERSETGLETHLSMSQRLGLVETKSIEEKTLQSETQEGFKLCQIDDLVLNRLKAHLGVFARATIPGLVSPDYTVFRLNVKASTRYFELLYKHPAYVAAFNKKVRGIVVGFLRLYTPDFYDILTLFPPLEEQDRIISFIHSEAMKVDRIISRTMREIDLIKEFRTTLISDAVTGKIDVRTAVKEEIPV